MKDFEQIRAVIRQLTDVPDEVWQEFSRHFVVQQFGKDEYFCREGQVENYIYFLRSGIVRSYFLKDGKEYTFDFFFENEFVTSFTSFISRQPSQVSVQALEKAETWKIHHQYIYELYDHSHQAERIGRKIAERQFMIRSRKELELVSLTAQLAKRFQIN
jgi:CRP-like cAMP-binding protein